MGRKDGIRVKDADPMYTIVPYIMDKRYDAMNMITLDIPVHPLKAYIRQKRQDGVFMSHLGLVMDERICSGHYFASCFQNMRRYFAHPELLEMTLDEDLAAENTVSENGKEDKA